ncbi:MAG: AzlD domain-containing protein [Butyrivibrio sp.]|nr:AzlD domain-containing protein [Muribaculum sp.]MCM1551661.1 AzlD domain-containing protein [Butyrivibrio sp.]
MNGDTYAVIAIGIMAGVTFLLRIIPFIIFSKGETPSYIEFFGKVLPYAIMGMLVVYCLKDISFLSAPFGIPAVLAVLLVAALHLWKRNTLLSIVGGTACYMLLIHLFG